MFCKKCGKQIDDDFKFCPHCGAPVTKEDEGSDDYYVYGNSSYDHSSMNSNPYDNQPYNNQPYNNQPYNNPYNNQQGNVRDTGSVWWGFLGLLSPLITLILYFVWRKSKPKTAKILLVGTIVGFILSIVTNLIFVNMIGELQPTVPGPSDNPGQIF